LETYFRFTKASLDNIVASNKRVRYRDSKVEGLCLDVFPTGRKSFRVYKRIKGKQSPVSITLGTYPSLTIENGRKVALKELERLANGINSNETKKVNAKLKMTLLDVYNHYISSKYFAKATIVGYDKMMQIYLKSWHNFQLNKIDENMVKTLHKESSCRSEAQADYSMRLLRALFNFARFEYKDNNDVPIFVQNPVKILSHQKLWNNVPRKQTYLNNSSIKKLLNELLVVRESDDPYMLAVVDLVEIGLFTGLRKSELLSLDWGRVNLIDRTFYINKTKNGMPLELPISNHLFSIFERRRKLTDNNYVFQADNEHGYLREPKKKIKELTEIIGVDFCMQDLRRTHTTIAESLRVGNYILKRLLNHKSQRNDVTQGYTVLTAEVLKEPAQQIENHILHLTGQSISSKEMLISKLYNMSDEDIAVLLSKL